ncbi:hypothetical protein FACS1894202_05820 [Clostridia bacterium]|nr:hypothetical protein FACS1894202_05820 [Clostridia bacterium]
MKKNNFRNIITLTVTAVTLAAGFAVMCVVLIDRAWTQFAIYESKDMIANEITRGRMMIPFVILGILVLISAAVVVGISYRAPHLGEEGRRKRMKDLEHTNITISAVNKK